MKSYLAMEDFANKLTQEERKLLGCKYDDWDTQQYLVPSDSTFCRVFRQTDAEELDRIIGEWTAEQIEFERIALDGKKLRGARRESGKTVNLVAAVAHGSGEVVAQEEVEEKTNEIKVAKSLLDKVDIEGKVVTADALHTQVDLAEYIKSRKAYYVFSVKGNQGNLQKEIEELEDSDFSP
jgi:hypothetical protein